MSATNLAKKIRYKLKEKQISAQALEKLAGLRPSVVHNILLGRSKNPTLQTLQAISKAFDCTLQELVDDEEALHDKQADIPWNLDLYEKTFHLAARLLKKHPLNLDKKKTLAFVDEIYDYSVSSQLTVADEHFAEWLVTRMLK
jgi:transcriptional regulator with XRE-family HTH domain